MERRKRSDGKAVEREGWGAMLSRFRASLSGWVERREESGEAEMKTGYVCA
jgi:hypothetical protein